MKYTTTPQTIEAVQWTGENLEELKSFCPDLQVITDKYGVSLKLLQYLNPHLEVRLQNFIVRDDDGVTFYLEDSEGFLKRYKPVN